MTEAIHSHHFSAILPVAAQLYGWTATDFLHLLKQQIQVVGLTLVSETSFTFQPRGISVVALLAESHVALHFWPELGKITLDIHVCDFHHDNLAKAKQLAELLAQTLGDRCQPVTWHALSITG
jgi:S-adenosylmethionine decarboxylase